MNTIAHHHQPARRFHRKAIASGLGVALLALTSIVACPAAASATESTHAASPIEKTADSLRAGYRQQQWERLSRNQDRDSLIAAVLLGTSNDTDHQPIPGHAAVEQRLAEGYASDPIAMYTLALVCQMQEGSCTHPEYRDQLLRIAPDNALHWLLLPNQTAPDAGQLHSAGLATLADSHMGTLIGILRDALANQPASGAGSGTSSHELALLLRRNAVEQVPLAWYGAVISACRPQTTASRSDCIQIGRRLYADRSGSIETRMIGSVLLRRLEKGSWEDTEVKQLRREYVWMGEQLDASDGSYKEQMQRDMVRYGEWSAMQRAVVRLGTSSTPPANWVPKHPQTLLMSEERTPAPRQ